MEQLFSESHKNYSVKVVLGSQDQFCKSKRELRKDAI